MKVGKQTNFLLMTCGFLIQLVFCKKKTMWLIGVELEQEMSAPPPKKNPGSTPASSIKLIKLKVFLHTFVLPLGSPTHCNSKESWFVFPPSSI